MNLVWRQHWRQCAIGTRAFFIFLLCLISCQTALAQGNVSARISWYGIYTVEKSKEIKDSRSPTGSRYESTPVPPTANSDRIPVQELRFGLAFILSGRTRTVTVREVYRFPPIVDQTTGHSSSSYESVSRRNIGESVLMGWKADDTTLPGPWTFEVWQSDRKLLEKSFTLYKP